MPNMNMIMTHSLRKIQNNNSAPVKVNKPSLQLKTGNGFQSINDIIRSPKKGCGKCGH